MERVHKRIEERGENYIISINYTHHKHTHTQSHNGLNCLVGDILGQDGIPAIPQVLFTALIHAERDRERGGKRKKDKDRESNKRNKNMKNMRTAWEVEGFPADKMIKQQL